MIILNDVRVTYGDGTVGLDGINLTVEKSEFAFIVGPTGSGKSTLFRVLIREVVPTEGRALVAGYDLTRMKPSQAPYLRRLVASVFQDILLLPERTVWENVAFALRATGAPSSEDKRAVPRALDMVDMLDKAKAFPSQLSGGEKQKVALARALVVKPLILLADEPTGNLDPQSSREVLELLLRVNRQGTTVLVATHDPLLIQAYRKRVIELKSGRIVRDRMPGVM